MTNEDYDIHQTLIDWLMAREVCRRLGFSADDITFECYPSGIAVIDGREFDAGAPIVGVYLHQGGKEFHWTIGVLPLSIEDIQPAFERAADLWNSGALGVTYPDFISSWPARSALRVMVELVNRGFDIKQFVPLEMEGTRP